MACADTFDNWGELSILPAFDESPARVARTSFGKGLEERSSEQDLKLVEYLMANNHNTPLEMTVLWFEIKWPIFIARQMMRHRTASFNEISGRYVQLDKEWYIPETVGGKPTNGAKQGQSDSLNEELQADFKRRLNYQCGDSYQLYESSLLKGVAPEHARMFLHLNHYTKCVMKMDLHNLMHLLELRLDAHAQIEARVYAQAIYDLVSEQLPETMKFFDTYRRKLDAADKGLLQGVLEQMGDADLNDVELTRLTQIFKRLGVK
jgi:thymidylate synthase (FAD)